MDHYDTALVEALSGLSPLARTKIRATLADPETEITAGVWATLFGEKNPHAKPRPCGCLMMDGYFKEHPPNEDDIWWDEESAAWSLSDDEWIDELIPFYEMQDYEDAVSIIGDAANAYDAWVGARNAEARKSGLAAKTVTKQVQRGVHVLRVPARRRLIKLVDKAST